jgi:hypothetical protein
MDRMKTVTRVAVSAGHQDGGGYELRVYVTVLEKCVLLFHTHNVEICETQTI